MPAIGRWLRAEFDWELTSRTAAVVAVTADRLAKGKRLAVSVAFRPRAPAAMNCVVAKVTPRLRGGLGTSIFAVPASTW